ncbi:MAG: 30S ribosomal protein S8 [bacterium]|nr:30S ribosomal protein S8 [bacterium]
MDKVGDLLIRIKNAYMASRKETVAPYSKLSLAICQLLVKEGYLEKCEAKERQIKIFLKYENDKTKTTGKAPALTDVKRVSKPGRRVYQGNKLLPRVYNGLGIAIISTPKGVMSDKQARKEKVGGEVMAFVW